MSLHFVISEDDENRTRMIFDTGAAINTGNLQYHMLVMSQCPEMVDKFLQCGKDTDYDVVHLLAALNLIEVATDIVHGRMTSVIRYKTPYTMNDKGYFVLSFTLGNGVRLRSVLDLPHFQ